MPTTASSTPVRRSQRIKEIVSSQPVVDDETIEGDGYDDEDEDEDDEDDETPRKRRKTGPAGKVIKGAPSKKGRKSAADTFNELKENFEENYIFQALNDAEVSISELANDWVQTYKAHKDLAKKDLINLILNAVGCFTKIEEHDVSNNESASETVSEIQTFFKRQKNHEFYLASKKPDYKHLKKNFINFMNEIISISDENGLLYENIVISEEDDEDVEEPEDSNLMEDLLIWLSSFSVSYIRALRYISTLSLLNIETTLCRIIVKVNSSLEKFKHQLEVEQKKATSTSKAAKKRIAQIESNVTQYSNQSLILENTIQDILNTTFIHRFKDIDYQIRVEAMGALGEWMDTYPELFFKVTYLKYLGWVLSDENASVRSQVIKTLIKLLKKNIIVTGLRQFFERFKTRVIEIAFHDVDHHVRTSAINLLIEINKVGFLEDEEIGKVSSLIFSSKDSKIIQLVSKFIQTVESENTKATLEALSVNIKSSEKLFPINLRDLIKIHNLIEILTVANEVYSENQPKQSLVKSNDLKPSLFAIAGKELFALSAYSEYWEFLIRYYLLDISSIEVADDELIKAIQLTAEQETILFGIIHGSLIHLKQVEDELKKKKKDDVDDASSQRLISHLPLILKKVENNDTNLSTFIQILSIYNIEFFENFNQANVYKSIFQELTKHFKNNSIETLKNEYIHLFKILSDSSGSTTIGEINVLFKDTITELIIEFENLLKDSDFELSSSTIRTIHEDYSFKLLVLGLQYDISEVFKTFEMVKDKIFTFLPDFEIEDEDVEPLSSLLKIYLSSTSWKLNFLLHTNEPLNIETELSQIPVFIQEIQYLLTKTNVIKFQTEVASVLIDLSTLLKNFFNEPNTNLTNLNRFYDIDLSSLSLTHI